MALKPPSTDNSSSPKQETVKDDIKFEGFYRVDSLNVKIVGRTLPVPTDIIGRAKKMLLDLNMGKSRNEIITQQDFFVNCVDIVLKNSGY